ncbi:MAG: hypothetical protein ABL964_09930 [Steroidobacteraceae bacterium]
MAFSGGVFTKLYTWVTEQASSPIEIAKLDTQESDFATGLSNCILRDGTGVPTATTPWNSQRLSSLGDATAATDAMNRQTSDARYPQSSSGSFTATMTGFTTSPTCAFAYVANGNMVTVRNSASFSATSNSTSFYTDACVTAAIRPSGNRFVVVYQMQDNSSSRFPCAVQITSAGIMTFYVLDGAGQWTASGSKGFLNAGDLVFTYSL